MIDRRIFLHCLELTLPAGLPGDITSLQLQLAGVSGFAGYTAGFAIKRTFRIVVFTTGVIFMGLQTLAHNDLITIHFDKIEEKFNTAVDLNGDGVIDTKDLHLGSDKVQAYLSAGLPSGASFSAGFLLGLRS